MGQGPFFTKATRLRWLRGAQETSLSLTERRRRPGRLSAALQHRIYQDAIAGNRAARRAVLRMIEKREKLLAASH
jgi:hypothetical protein